MSVKLRLSRKGRMNTPFYRIVAIDSRKPTDGLFLENIGWYDPKKPGVNFEIKLDRAEYWIANGAQMSPSVNSMVKKCRLGDGVAQAPVKAAAKATAEPEPAPAEAAPAEAAAAPEAAE